MKTIPVLIPDMPQTKDLLPYLRRIDDAKWYTNFGSLENELVTRLSQVFTGCHVATVANATQGIQLALEALELDVGARVLVPSFTFPATALAVIAAQLEPVFCDVDLHTWALTPELADEPMRRFNAEAVVAVCPFGAALPVRAWQLFSDKFNAPVIFDAAAAYGNQLFDDADPSLPDIVGVFSMHATKNLGAGEGGIVVSSHKRATINYIRMLTNFGLDMPGGHTYMLGATNAKLSEYHAAVALASLDRWDSTVAWRRQVLEVYREALGEFAEGTQRLRVPSTLSLICRANTNEATRVLRGKGVQTRQWYTPALHTQAIFSHLEHTDMSYTDELARLLIGVPFHNQLSREDIFDIVGAVAPYL